MVDDGAGLEEDLDSPALHLGLPRELLVGIRYRMLLGKSDRVGKELAPYAQVPWRVVRHGAGGACRVDMVPATVVVAACAGGEMGWQIERATHHLFASIVSRKQLWEPACRGRTIRVQKDDWIPVGNC